MSHKAQQSEPLITCENLSKWYGQVIALNNINLVISQGITGLLGPNGAGKTTLLELIMGRLKPSRGRVLVLGKDPWESPEIYRTIGYCPDSEGIYDAMSGLTFVKTMAELSGVAADASDEIARARLVQVGLGDDYHRPMGTYSKGMKQRVKLAAALVHNPALLILDEPLNGLDPLARYQFTHLLRQLGRDGLTILVSSHILAEVEAMTSRVILIHHGNLIAEGEIADIRALIENQPYTYRVECDLPRRLAQELIALEKVESVAIEDDARALIVRTTDANLLCRHIQKLAVQNELQIQSLAPVDESLEAVFQYLVRG